MGFRMTRRRLLQGSAAIGATTLPFLSRRAAFAQARDISATLGLRPDLARFERAR